MMDVSFSVLSLLPDFGASRDSLHYRMVQTRLEALGIDPGPVFERASELAIPSPRTFRDALAQAENEALDELSRRRP